MSRTPDDPVRKIANAPARAPHPATRQLALDVISDWLPLLCALAIAQLVPWSAAHLLAWLAIGVYQHRLAILGHEGAHYLLHSSRASNDLIANLFMFWPLGITALGYRRFHLQHHRHTATADDPENGFKRSPAYRRPMPLHAHLRHFLGDLVGGGMLELQRLTWSMRPKRLDEALGLALFWASVIGVVAAMNLWMALATYLAAFLTSFWAIFRVRAWSEHTDISGTYRFEPPAFLAYLFFPRNTWCHFEHHKWPYLGYRELPKARLCETETPVLTLSELYQTYAVPADRT